MLKKIKYLLLVQLLIALPASANDPIPELSYTSFRPFIHFQLDFESYDYDYDAQNAYQSSYLNGYMDGVNRSYHYCNERYYADSYEDAYESGYRDGIRDHKLLIRLRGQAYAHRFGRHDYFSPYYSVKIWLDGLSFAFLHAPARYLPERWEYYVHPRVKRYRRSLSHQEYKKHGYHNGKHRIERAYYNRISHYRDKAQHQQKTYRYRKQKRYHKHLYYDHTYRNKNGIGNRSRTIIIFKNRNQTHQKKLKRNEYDKNNAKHIHRKRVQRLDPDQYRNRNYKRDKTRNNRNTDDRRNRNQKRDY